MSIPTVEQTLFMSAKEPLDPSPDPTRESLLSMVTLFVRFAEAASGLPDYEESNSSAEKNSPARLNLILAARLERVSETAYSVETSKAA